jgi:Kdo2-lipid IVA lauroyltransferase/acyltransferase
LSTKDRAGDEPNPPRQPFRYRLEAAGLRAATVLVPLLPRDVAMGLGRVLGRLAYLLLREDRRVAYANLDIVFGDTKSRREKRRIARRSFQNLTCNLVGLFWAPRITAQNFRQFVDVDESNFQWVRDMRDQGRGVIFITPHYGDWEMMSLASGYLRTPYTTVTEPTKNPAIQETISRLRSLSGHTTVHPRFAVVKPFKALSRAQTVGVLIDVNARRGRGGVWLDFFGLKVFNTAAVVELAMRTHAFIVFGAAHPLPGRRIRIQFGPIIPVDDTGDREKDVLATSQRCLDECAKLIRENPDYWLWSYKRWKRRPSPEIGKYPFYSKYDANT